ncbi:MAG: hypothetical protein QOF19_2160 [Alphaproteobacteria bacterium]|nr:hypothetical protein [Alphaproteobacteria bacterium]
MLLASLLNDLIYIQLFAQPRIEFLNADLDFPSKSVEGFDPLKQLTAKLLLSRFRQGGRLRKR